MKKNKIFLKNSISAKYLNDKNRKKFSKDFPKIFDEIRKNLSQPKKTLNILSEKYFFNFKLNDLKKFKNFKKVAVIGMGGSILGTEAIYNFLEKKIKRKFYFFNDINEDGILKLKKKEKISNILFIIISKSGNTIETISNIIAFDILKNKSKNIIIISEKKNNFLFNFSKKFNLFYIEHKNYVGGRYSVLSEVGIVPAYFMGINTIRLRSEIRNVFKKDKKNFSKIVQLN